MYPSVCINYVLGTLYNYFSDKNKHFSDPGGSCTFSIVKYMHYSYRLMFIVLHLFIFYIVQGGREGVKGRLQTSFFPHPLAPISFSLWWLPLVCSFFFPLHNVVQCCILFSLSLPRVPKIKIQDESQISFVKY